MIPSSVCGRLLQAKPTETGATELVQPVGDDRALCGRRANVIELTFDVHRRCRGIREGIPSFANAAVNLRRWKALRVLTPGFISATTVRIIRVIYEN